jgi:ATP-dependent RNA helicase DDX35
LQPIYAVPLYETLSIEDQEKAFETPLPDTRKVVIATSIAEVSITIVNIVYVIDCGFTLIRSFDHKCGLESLVIVPISKSSAIQRAGRAGRTRPGKVYRLYSEVIYETLQILPIPEISRSDLSKMILTLLSIGIKNILKFDFMTRPSVDSLSHALQLLFSLNAIDRKSNLTVPFGVSLAEFPLEPKLAAMILNSPKFKCSSEVLIIAAMLSVPNVFQMPANALTEARKAKKLFSVEEGDLFTLINGSFILTQFMNHLLAAENQKDGAILIL